MPEFRFTTPYEYGRTCDRDDFTDLFDAAPETRPSHWLGMLAGFASRPDLSPRTLKQVFGACADHDAWAALAVAINNPITAASTHLKADAGGCINGDSIYTLLGELDHPEDFIDRFIIVSGRHSNYPGGPDRVREAFLPAQIAAATDALVEEYCAATFDPSNPMRRSNLTETDLAQNTFLTSAHLASVLDHAHAFLTAALDIDPGLPPETGNCGWVVAAIMNRNDLTEALSHRAQDCLELLDDATARLASLYGGHHYERRGGVKTAAPDSVLVRALMHPGNTRLKYIITSQALNEALEKGASAYLLADYTHTRLTLQALAMVLDQGEKALAAGGSVEGARAAFDRITTDIMRTNDEHIATPEWDRLVRLWRTTRNHLGEAEFGEALAQTVTRSSFTRWADESKTDPSHAFAAWCANQDNPHLRRLAVTHVYLPAQLDAVVVDPSPVVRAMVATHELVTPAHLSVLANDPDEAVRRVVAEHDRTPTQALEGLAQDHDVQVRRTLACRDRLPAKVLAMLADDTDTEVRNSVDTHVTHALQDT